jgi:hypothetical protein
MESFDLWGIASTFRLIFTEEIKDDSYHKIHGTLGNYVRQKFDESLLSSSIPHRKKPTHYDTHTNTQHLLPTNSISYNTMVLE